MPASPRTSRIPSHQPVGNVIRPVASVAAPATPSLRLHILQAPRTRSPTGIILSVTIYVVYHRAR